MSGAPRVTIGLPVYNGERYLSETIDGLLAQTMGDLELIVCDNASTDGTEEIVRAFASTDRRVRYERHAENRGAAYNYNRCVELARAPLFKWSAADDLCCPRVLEVCAAELDAHPAAVLAYPSTRIIDADGRELHDYDDRLDLRQDSAALRFAESLRLLGECNAVFGLVRTVALRRTARIAPYPGSDVVLVTELALHGCIHRLPGATFFRRDHDAASSSERNRSIEFTYAFYDPRRPRRRWMLAWRHLRERWSAIRRAPLAARERWRCVRRLMREALKDRRKLWAELKDPTGREYARRRESRAVQNGSDTGEAGGCPRAEGGTVAAADSPTIAGDR